MLGRVGITQWGCENMRGAFSSEASGEMVTLLVTSIPFLPPASLTNREAHWNPVSSWGSGESRLEKQEGERPVEWLSGVWQASDHRR